MADKDVKTDDKGETLPEHARSIEQSIQDAIKQHAEPAETNETEVETDDTATGGDEAETIEAESEATDTADETGPEDKIDDVSRETSGEKEPEPIELPEDFPEEKRAAFEAMPREAQEWALNEYKSFQAGFTKKTQELAGDKKFKEKYGWAEQIFAPLEQALMMHGLTPQQYVGQLLAIQQGLQTNPEQTIKHLAQQRGVALDGLQEADEYQDPEIRALKEEIANLRQGLTVREQTEAQNQQSHLMDQIRLFGTEKDADGNLTHPHFDAVMDDMARLAVYQRNQGIQPELNQLYEQAVWSNPEVRQTLLDEQKKSLTAEDAGKKQAKATKAKKAAKSVTKTSEPGSDKQAVDFSKMSIEQTVRHHMEKSEPKRI